MLEVNPNLNNNSGIYFLTRTDENGIKHCYIGQAKHILTRLAQHLSGYQYIDNSLKSHGLFSHDNKYGWKVGFLNYAESELNDKEQYYITAYAKNGYQMKNRTAGSQGKGKVQIAEYRPSKTYRDGLRQGFINASKEISNLFEKHLNFSKKSDKPNKNQDKAVEKFENFLNAWKEGSKNVE